MKFGISLSTYKTKFGAIVFSSGNIIKELKIINKLGYDGVDLFVNKLNNRELEKMHSLLKTYNLEIPLLLPIWLTEKKSYLTDLDKYKRKQAIRRYKTQIVVASKLHAINMPIGFSRGHQQEELEKFYYHRLADSLKELIEFANFKNIKLLIEPINRYELNTLNRVDQTLEFISKYNLEQIYILLDTFHMNIEESSIEKAIELSGSMTRHIHISDSNRLSPGNGHLNYDSILNSIIKIGYDEFLTIEAYPIPSTYECAKNGIEFLKNRLIRYIN